MTRSFEELARLNKLIHQPVRLAIMTALSSCDKAEFLFLQQLLGLTMGNLSSHLSKLEESGLLQIEKQFVGKRPHTMVSLTQYGHDEIERHWQLLEQLQKDAAEITSRKPGIEFKFKGAQ